MTKQQMVAQILVQQAVPQANRPEATKLLMKESAKDLADTLASELRALDQREGNTRTSHMARVLAQDLAVRQERKSRKRKSRKSSKKSRKSRKSRKASCSLPKALLARARRISQAIKAGRISVKQGRTSPKAFAGNSNRERYEAFVKAYAGVHLGTSRRSRR
jgi:hypothetical protein